MLLIFTLLASSAAQAAQHAVVHPYLIEVFTTTDLPVTGESTISQQADYMESELHVYELDGIQRIEAKLSKDLTADPEQSKLVVLQRFQQLHDGDRAQMQRAAMGLAKAVQYGIDRYPAMVFDGQVVVYGLTDLEVALQHYRSWRAGNQP